MTADDPDTDAGATSVVVESDGRGRYYAHHDVSESGLSVTVTLAVAEVEGVEPDELLPELRREVDPDALDHLFRPLPGGDRRGGGPLELSIGGARVTVYSDGTIEIRS